MAKNSEFIKVTVIKVDAQLCNPGTTKLIPIHTICEVSCLDAPCDGANATIKTHCGSSNSVTYQVAETCDYIALQTSICDPCVDAVVPM